MKLLCLDKVPIFKQLQIEEALLRADKGNWCLINTGSSDAIVMGISGKPETLLNINRVKRDRIPVIRRFSGGGTVYIDPKTVFVTVIANSEDLDIPAQPKPILEWSEKLYKPVFQGFEAKENDYVIGERKFGGNAQYIQKGRWLHHTSLLWDFTPLNMEYLLLPEKRPHYRLDRSHTDFLCTLKEHYTDKTRLVHALKKRFKEMLKAEEVPLAAAEACLNLPHRKVSTFLDL